VKNVSALEVEQAIQKHPDVLEAAVYAVPSELAEDDIMASITLVEGRTLKETALIENLKENLPKFAVPRYVKNRSGIAQDRNPPGKEKGAGSIEGSVRNLG